jgi:hypothetical protein
MKKVLILAYDFPPYVSVGGLRPYSWYKYFHEFGLYPVVVTRQWGNQYGNQLDYIAPGESKETLIEENETGCIIRTAYKPNLSNRLLLKYGEKRFRLLRKAITAYYEFMQFLFFVGPKSGLYRGAKQYLKQHQVDTIIATGAPHILFKYAAKLSKKHNIPWIADYRDPWSQSKSRSYNYFTTKWNRYFETLYLKKVTFIITVSDYYNTLIGSLLKNPPIYSITNGFIIDEDNVNIETKQRNDKLGFAFIGTIYKWHPYREFFAGIEAFVKSKSNPLFEFTFYGVNNQVYFESIIDNDFPFLKEYIRFEAKMPTHVLMLKLKREHLMLLFNYYSMLGTKIYDYLSLKRKVLFCFSEEHSDNIKEFPYEMINGINEQQKIINATQSGVIVRDSKHLVSILNLLYADFIRDRYISCHSKNTEQYSRKAQVKRLAMLLIENIND